MGGHLADDMRIVPHAGGAGIPGPSVGLGRGAWGEVGSDKGMQALGGVIRHLLETNAAGAGAAVLYLDGADDQDLASMAAAAATDERIVLAAAEDFGLVDLDQAAQRRAVGRHHAATQLGTQQPSGLVGTQGELALQLQRRDAVGMGGHQIGGPEPGGQRQLGVMQDRAGGHRGLPAAGGTLPSPRLGLQPPGLARAATGAAKALRPTLAREVGHARGLVRKALLELNQRAGEVGHGGLPIGSRSWFVLSQSDPTHHNILQPRTQRDKP